ncbi:sensor histidine kinase [Paraflavitalea pollutisoli]|uniref:sensor histidine kinase n=1 Tax=Paraflavitalea pollutisoli TaxID=3034143 RepID=UPI0023EDFB83|nr:sensor histidine kinase [Paraflavitalea sp. H1-2-19X]
MAVLWMMATVVPLSAQLPAGLSRAALQQRLEVSKPDSNRVLLLMALGKTYFGERYSDDRALLMDSAIGIFRQAIQLSERLQLKNWWLESMQLEGDAHLGKLETDTGIQLFSRVAGIYHAQGEPSKEAHAWLRLARQMSWGPPYFVQIQGFYDKAIHLFVQTHDLVGEADARVSLSDYLWAGNHFDATEKELLHAIDLHRQMKSTRVSPMYNYLSEVNRYRGAYEKSLRYATTCVDNALLHHDTIRIDLYYGELALVYDELGRCEESSYWYRKTLQKRIDRKINRTELFKTANLLIRQLVKLQRSREALAMMDSLVRTHTPKTIFEKAIALQNYALCYDALKQYAAAENYYNSMAAYFRQAPLNEEYVFGGNLDIGRFYLQHGQYVKAHGYLDSALAYRGARLTDQRALQHMLFTADSALGNYTAAIRDLQQYELLSDSLYNEKKSRQIEELTIQYETEKKVQNIRLLEKETRFQQAELNKEKNTRRWMLGVGVLLVVIVALLINYARLKQRTNSKLQVQQLVIERKNDDLQHLVEEKEWLVREIHHRVKNNFHTVMGLLRTQSAYLQGDEAIEALAESQQRIQAMSLVHQKLYQSDNLSAINMAAYIHELVDYLKDSFHTGRTIRFNLRIEPVALNISQCIPLGLILNEAITNAIKYAFPDKREGRIDVVLEKTLPDHYILSIKDNGVGLPPCFDPEKSRTLGMKLMRGLSGDLDTSLQLIHDNGTEIRLDFVAEA